MKFKFCSCAELSTTVCPTVNCEDNPLYKCQVKVVNHRKTCVCPSCEAARDRPWCVKTKLVNLNPKSVSVNNNPNYLLALDVLNKETSQLVSMTVTPKDADVQGVPIRGTRNGVFSPTVGPTIVASASRSIKRKYF